jgi:hypothetical protein
MRRRGFLGPERGNEADDVSLRYTSRCGSNPKVTILSVFAQSLLEVGFAVMANGEFLFGPRLGPLWNFCRIF